MNPLTFGITFSNEQNMSQVLGGSGLNQNSLFFYELLETLGHEVYLLTGYSRSESIEAGGYTYKLKGFDYIKERQEPFDIIFEVGLSLSIEQHQELANRCGARKVSVRYGNTYFLDVEQMFVTRGEDGDRHNQGAKMVWISPHFSKSISYVESLYQCPTVTCPFIWEPRFVGRTFNVGEYRRKPDIYVMEPNFSVLKNALIPMLIINEVCLDDPDMFGIASIQNSDHFYKTPFFLNNFARNLPFLSSQHDKVYFSVGRSRIYDVFTKPDILIGFQHENELNYLYMEALSMGIPLVHNSPTYIDVGFYYPELDVQRGVMQTKNAIREYDPIRANQINQEFLYRFSIHNPAVQNRYIKLIDEAMSL